MIKIISIVIQVIAVAGGASLGLWLKSSQPESAASKDESAHAEAIAATGKDDGTKEHKSDKKKKSKSGHGEEEPADSGSGYGFVKFGRQFIVPVVQGSAVTSLVVLDINLEVVSSATESAYSQEPKLRDSVLGALLQLSNEGAFNEQLIEHDNIDRLRARLLEAVRAVIGDDVNDVLILSVARQDL